MKIKLIYSSLWFNNFRLEVSYSTGYLAPLWSEAETFGNPEHDVYPSLLAPDGRVSNVLITEIDPGLFFVDNFWE